MGSSTEDYVVPAKAPANPKATGQLVFWLPPEEAALRFGVNVDQLVAATRRGDLRVQAKVAGGELLATLCSTELIALYGQPLRGKLEHPIAAKDQAELARLRDELADRDLRLGQADVKRAHLQGELKAADRVERSLQRYADRVEQRLEDVSVTYEARLAEGDKLRLNMARTMGRMETEMLQLQERVRDAEADSTPLALGEGAKSRAPKKPKRRWFFGR